MCVCVCVYVYVYIYVCVCVLPAELGGSMMKLLLGHKQCTPRGLSQEWQAAVGWSHVQDRV